MLTRSLNPEPPNPESLAMRYLHLDVFTDRPFEGNQLAVFPEPSGLSTAQMQTIAREMNFSESTFIFPAEGEGGGPAGRPGEDADLHTRGRTADGRTSDDWQYLCARPRGNHPPGQTDFVFELGVGPTPVSLEWSGDRLSFAWMTHSCPRSAILRRIGRRGRRRSESRRVTSPPAAAPGDLVRRAVHVRPVTSRAAVDRVRWIALR